MNTVEAFQTTSTLDTSGGSGVAVSLSLGFLVLVYLLYDHFEKKLTIQTAMHQETEARFHVTEDKLATLEELQEEVQRLKEAEEERKSSWEDDVTEPNKYQAIVGSGTVNGIDVELRFISEKLNTFKSNRYWLLNNEINHNTLRFILDGPNGRLISKYFKEKNDKLVSTLHHLSGLDEMLRIECHLPKRWNPPYEADTTLSQTVYSIRENELQWKRALINAGDL